MRCTVYYSALLIFLNSYAYGKTSCDLDLYFSRTEEYKSTELDNKEKEIELDRVELSLLPNAYVSLGQYSSNDYSFKSFKKSSLSFGISQSVYEGDSYGKNKKRIKADTEYNKLLIHEKRNKYMVDLFRSVIDHKYKRDLFDLYKSQQEKQNIQLEASKASLASGGIARIEYDIVSLRKDEIQNNLERVKNEIKQSEIDIYTKFNIPINIINDISGDTLLACRKEKASYILEKSRELLKKKEYINYDLEMASLQPNVSLSINFRPPDTGAWSDFTLKKSDFGASIDVSIPVSNIYSMNSIRKRHAISVSRIENSHDEKNKLYIREKESVLSKINDLDSDIKLSKRSIELKEKEVDYMRSRFNEKKETIMSYYRQLDELEQAKINLKKVEREIEYYKFYISVLD